VPRAVVFLVLARFLVLLDQSVVVFVHREAAITPVKFVTAMRKR
jgi:hypothetical protein